MNETVELGFEVSTIERERWTAAILGALQELRRASAGGLCRHGCSVPNEDATSGTRRQSIPPAAPEPAR